MEKTKTNNRWKFLTGTFIGLLMFFTPAFGQEVRKVTGTVTDASGQPVPSINITVQGTGTGASTDETGHFSLLAKRGDELLVSGIGFQKQRIKIGEETNLSIKLVEAGNNLNE